MRHLTYDISEEAYHAKPFDFYFSDMSCGAFDIETTGLSPDRCYVILIGFMKISDGVCRLHQYFADSLSEEADIIRAFLRDAEDTDVLITYNGRSFDIPFLEKRMSRYPDLSEKRLLFYDLDLYPMLKKHSPLKNFLPNLKQKTVEDFMGLWDTREDEISGGESVDLYFRYLACRDGSPSAGEGPDSDEILELILCHNRDDVLQLSRLLPVLNKADLHGAMYDTGFPLKISPPEQNETGKGPGGLQEQVILVDKISITPRSLEVYGKQQYNGTDHMIFESPETPYTFSMDSVEMSIRASVPLLSHESMNDIFIADLRPLGIDEGPFASYPQFSDGLLVLKEGKDVNHLQTVHFVKEFLEKVLCGIC